jgi:hypothetical protein
MKKLLFISFLCFSLSGCSTLGALGSGLAGGLASLIKLPFKAISTALDIASKCPKPPPGVFF